ncbi:hypothetical protein A5692_00035 [Mycobacterium sp. E342]|nr:hypothetical protein A5692_00035 [Mycobacterium sp. E342]
MSGPKPPEWEPEEPDSVNEAPHQPDSDGGPADGPESAGEPGPDDELEPFDDGAEPAAEQTGQTDAYSRAYSAPESEHFMSGPYLPADLRLYDYDAFDESDDTDEEHGAPRWPWVVGIAAIVAAIALVVIEQLSRLTRKRLDASTEPTSDWEMGVTVIDHGMYTLCWVRRRPDAST